MIDSHTHVKMSAMALKTVEKISPILVKIGCRNSQALAMASLMPFQTLSQIFFPVSVFVKKKTNAATSAAMAITMSAIGFALSAAFHAHCATVIAVSVALCAARAIVLVPSDSEERPIAAANTPCATDAANMMPFHTVIAIPIVLTATTIPSSKGAKGTSFSMIVAKWGASIARMSAHGENASTNPGRTGARLTSACPSAGISSRAISISPGIDSWIA